MTVRQRTAAAVALLVLAPIAACTSSGSKASTVTGSPSALSSSAPASAAVSSELSSHVRVLGLWSGPEYDNFVAVKSVWEKQTGDTVDWQGTQDISGALDADAAAGTSPDIAVLPNLALMRQLAKDGKLVPLNSVLNMTQINDDYAPPWVDLGSVNGNLYGIFYKVADKSTVWYSPTAFAAGNYTVPPTWDDMTKVASEMVADGHTPFSIVAASGPASGWPLTDWISEIVLNNCGPDVYDQWVAAEIPWTDACIKQSFEMFDSIVQTKGDVLGGTQRILTTGDADGADPLYTKPPTAYMYYLSSIAQGFIESQYPDLRAGRDYGVFPIPTINPQYREAITIGADIVVMTRDTPAARSFMTYLEGAAAQEVWIKLGGFTSANRSVPPATYPDTVSESIAADVADAEIVRFGAGDSMPVSLQRVWWTAMLQLVKDPSQLDAILNSLTAAAKTAT
jgi:alpha-glucoside transport system substrate-binding protein